MSDDSSNPRSSAENVVVSIDGGERIQVPEVLPLLPVRDLVVFPNMIVPLLVSRDMSISAIDEALARDRLVLLAAQRELSDDHPSPDGIYTVGTVGMVMRMRKLSDGETKVLVQGLVKARVLSYVRQQPSYMVRVERVSDAGNTQKSLETEALMRTAVDSLERLISVGKVISPDIMLIVADINEPGRLADLIVSNLGLKTADAQVVLETHDPVHRLRRVNEFLAKEIEVLAMQARIESRAKEEMNRTQREYFLREQLRQIQSELGDIDSKTEEIEDFRRRVTEAEMPDEVEKEALKQARRLEQMHADSAEASITRTYLEWLCDLPWSPTKTTPDNFDLVRAREILDEDHYGLERVKERILEYLAVLRLKREKKRQERGPILCLVGPPGVGKTSLGRSIARALGRRFIRISLGGVRDEAEIRGHRRTYVGAMPGRVILGIKNAGSNNPVFMLDEIDKLGADFRGDPASALLEVLDPEQNQSFSDHYLNVPFDLTKVLFIATANLADPIPAALRDRMEVIRLSGYSLDQKVHIARRYLLPKQLHDNGLEPGDLQMPDSTLERVIADYTAEAGLRNLEREIARVCRKVARGVADGNAKSTRINASRLPRFLGPARVLRESPDDVGVGVSAGLAWTQSGGEVLYVEATAVPGKGRLLLTGQLGDVMKESAQAAFTFIRGLCERWKLDPGWFGRHEIHVHVPAGAIPKDGPSAGIAVAAALTSLITGQPLRSRVAMTGEITLTGRVLAVGGVREKLLAAQRAGMDTVLIPAGNEKDLEELPAKVRRKLKIIPVAHAEDALAGLLKLPSPEAEMKVPAVSRVSTEATAAPAGDSPEAPAANFVTADHP